MSFKGLWRPLAAAAFLAASLIVPAQPLWAAIYYVDAASGSNEQNGRTPGTAWGSVPGTVDGGGGGWVKLEPGDTVRVKRGSTFRQPLQVRSDWYATDASAQRPITIEADPNWGSGPVVWDGSDYASAPIDILEVDGIRLEGNTADGIVIRNAAWHAVEATGAGPEQKMQGLSLRHILVTNSARRAIQLFRQNDFELVRVRVDGAHLSNEASGICIGESGDNGCSNGRLDYCQAFRLGPQGVQQPAGTDAYQGFWIVNSSNLTLNYCDAYQNSGRGFDIGGVSGSTPVPLSDNIILNYCRAFENGNDGFGSSAEDMPESDPSRHYFNYCLAYANGNGGWQIYEGPTTYLYNCVSDQNGTALRLWGVNPGMNFQNGRSSHISVYNCILSRPQAESDENGAGTVFVGYVNQLDLKMDYNFYVQGASDRAAVWGYYAPGPAISYRYNKAEAPGGQSKWFADQGLDEHSLCSLDGYDVGFLDAPRRDYRLSAGSDAVDTGCGLGPKLDYDGTTAPQGRAKDIGAFEYSKAGRTMPAPRGVRAVGE